MQHTMFLYVSRQRLPFARVLFLDLLSKVGSCRVFRFALRIGFRAFRLWHQGVHGATAG